MDWEFQTLSFVMAYNGLHNLSPTAYISDAKVQKWKLEKLKAFQVAISTCLTDSGRIDYQNIATEVDILRHGLQKAVTVLSSVSGTPAHRGRSRATARGV